MKLRILIAFLLSLVFVSSANADVTKLWAPMQLNNRANPTALQLARFGSRVVSTHPLAVPTWQYVKASRSPKSNWPEKWYLHQNGVRIKDFVYHMWVMNPNSLGWQKQVAATCLGKCFLDGAGDVGLGRTTPKLQWTTDQWVAAMIREIDYVRSTGDKVIPNSVGVHSLAEIDAAGRGSTEQFHGIKHLNILTYGRVWVVAYDHCAYQLASFLIGRGRGDYFECTAVGADPSVVTAPMNGPSIGKALGPAVPTATGYTRLFQGGKVTANYDGTYVLP